MKLANLATGALIASLSVAIASPVQAQLLGSKVQILASNGFGGGGHICKSAFKLTTVGDGSELLGSDWTGSRCVGFYTGDIMDDLLTLTVGQGGNYSYADFNLQVQSGGTITGFSFLGYDGVFLDPNYPLNGTNFAPVTSFGDNFVDVLWDGGSDNNQFGFGDQGDGTGTATFAFTTSPIVTTDGGSDIGGGDTGGVVTAAFITTDTGASVTPEPATIALLAPGLAGIAALKRRRKRSTP